MKIGLRTPSLKKSLKARTTGKLKRQMKKAVNPLYGKKGMGLINNPKKAVYNKVYSKTTVDPLKSLKSTGKKSSPKKTTVQSSFTKTVPTETLVKRSDLVVEKTPQQSSEKNKPNYVGMIIFIIIGLITLPNIFISGIFFVLAYFCYKNEPAPSKPKKQKKPRKKSKKEIQYELENLVARLENNIVRVGNHEKVLKETLSVDKFTDSLQTVFTIVNESYELMTNARELSPNIDIQGLQNGLDLINSSKPELEEDFVKRYYFENIKHANSLKTENGRLNNIANGKAKLLEKSDIFEPVTIDLIETIYK